MKIKLLSIVIFLLACQPEEQKDAINKEKFLAKQKEFLAAYEANGVSQKMVIDQINYLQTINFSKDSNSDNIGVETFLLKKDLVQDHMTFDTKLEAYQELNLTAFVSGKLKSMNKNGTYVKQGSSILSIDGDLYLKSFEAANANFEQAKKSFEKWERDINVFRKLHKSKDISDDELSKFELNYLSAKSQLKQSDMQRVEAQKRYHDAILAAPFSGLIGNFNLTAGQQINSGQYLGKLADFSKMKAEVSLSLEELRRFKVGDKASFIASSAKLNGYIETLSKLPDPKTGSYLCILVFPNSDSKVNVSGLYGKVTIYGERYDSVFFVNQDAIVKRNNKSYLFKVQNNVLKLTEISEVKEIGSVSIITGSINNDDRIVSRGTGKLAENLKVRIIK